eukprot:m.100980 g.100980  ORF g.100980 m.100980 type:complete len:180 (-) comp15151_c0_seq2:1187-1726(-)
MAAVPENGLLAEGEASATKDNLTQPATLESAINGHSSTPATPQTTTCVTPTETPQSMEPSDLPTRQKRSSHDVHSTPLDQDSSEPQPRRSRGLSVTWSPKLISELVEMHSSTDYDRSLISADSYACDGCSYYITGDRWHCTMCDNYDLCEACYQDKFDGKVTCKHGKTFFVCMQEGGID